MVKITRVGEEPPLHCPRGCGNLRYGRTLQGKTNNCKNCKGIMLTLDEIQTMEKGGIKRFNKMRRNKLGELLSSATQGNLNCPKCSKKMNEIHLDYKRGRHMAKQEEATWKSVTSPNLGNLVSAIPIIWVIEPILDLASDLKHGKLDKSVAIDACPSCFIFWFDKTELMRVTANDVTVKKENSSVKVAPPNSQPTPGVVTTSKSELE